MLKLIYDKTQFFTNFIWFFHFFRMSYNKKIDENDLNEYSSDTFLTQIELKIDDIINMESFCLSR